MAITTIALDQSANWQTSETRTRNIQRATEEVRRAVPENVVTRALINAPTDQPIASNNQPVLSMNALSADMAKTRMILETYFGRKFELPEDRQAPADNIAIVGNSFDMAVTGADTDTNHEVVIDGVRYPSDQLLHVEQSVTRSQQLAYSMDGEFMLDSRPIQAHVSFSLTSETRFSQSSLTLAANLRDPLVIQFGAQTIGDINGHVLFDINRDGELNHLPIFTGDVGYLVFDKNQNGFADDGGELFGPATQDGFAELSAFDSNHNGFIDREDAQYSQLYVWQPGNVNDGWKSLAATAIAAIHLSAVMTPFDFLDHNNNLQAQLRSSSFALTENGTGLGVHQVDVWI